MSYENAHPFNPWAAARAATAYMLDAWRQTILTWDVLRERRSQPSEQATSGELAVDELRVTGRARVEHWYFSQLNPWMPWIKMMAEAVRKNSGATPNDPSAPPARSAARRITESLDLDDAAESFDWDDGANDDGARHDAAWLDRVVREASCA